MGTRVLLSGKNTTNENIFHKKIARADYQWSKKFKVVDRLSIRNEICSSMLVKRCEWGAYGDSEGGGERTATDDLTTGESG